MTRRDYVAIGRAIRYVRERYLPENAGMVPMPEDTRAYVLTALDDVALQVAAVFENDNSRFDRERFLRFVSEDGRR